MKKIGTCGVCHSKFTLNKDNTLRKHGHTNSWYGGTRVSSFCKGASFLPLEISDETLKIARNLNRVNYVKCREKYGNEFDYTNVFFDSIIKNSKSIKNWKPKEESK